VFLPLSARKTTFLFLAKDKEENVSNDSVKARRMRDSDFIGLLLRMGKKFIKNFCFHCEARKKGCDQKLF
jgi:hypothetical protein